MAFIWIIRLDLAPAYGRLWLHVIHRQWFYKKKNIVKRLRDTAAQEILVGLMKSLGYHGLRQDLGKFWLGLVQDAPERYCNRASTFLMVSKLHREDPKKDVRCPNKLKMVKRWPQIRAHELQGVPRWVQGGPRWTQDGHKMGPRWTQDGSKMPQEDHELDQNGPIRGQNGTQVATQMQNLVLTKVSKSLDFLTKNEDQEGLNGGHGASLGRYR